MGLRQSASPPFGFIKTAEFVMAPPFLVKFGPSPYLAHYRPAFDYYDLG